MSGPATEGGPTTTLWDEEASPASDLADRSFKAQAPDQGGMADITSLKTISGFLYPVVVCDVFSRKTAGRSLENNLRTGLSLNGLDIVAGQNTPKDVIYPFDRGCRYTALPSAVAARKEV